jgi:hypothetical protein
MYFSAADTAATYTVAHRWRSGHAALQLAALQRAASSCAALMQAHSLQPYCAGTGCINDLFEYQEHHASVCINTFTACTIAHHQQSHVLYKEP